MSLVTPTYAIPYLTPGDRMAAIPAVDKAQSMRIEELLKTANVPPGNPDLNDVLARLNALESSMSDSGWVNVPMSPGITGTLRYRMRNGLVEVSAGVSGDFPTGGAVTIGVLPVIARPSLTERGAAGLNVGNSGTIGAYTNGDITINHATGATRTAAQATVTYFAG